MVLTFYNCCKFWDEFGFLNEHLCINTVSRKYYDIAPCILGWRTCLLYLSHYTRGIYLLREQCFMQMLQCIPSHIGMAHVLSYISHYTRGIYLSHEHCVMQMLRYSPSHSGMACVPLLRIRYPRGTYLLQEQTQMICTSTKI